MTMQAQTNSNSLTKSVLHSTLHDRDRRKQRQITKEDWVKARRLGMVEIQDNGLEKITYGGKKYIYNPRTKTAVTCYNDYPEKVGAFTGSKFVEPIILHKSEEHTTDQAMSAHNNRFVKNMIQKELWKSHTVLVVDMSGPCAGMMWMDRAADRMPCGRAQPKTLSKANWNSKRRACTI